MEVEALIKHALHEFEQRLREAVEAILTSADAAGFCAAERQVHGLTEAIGDRLVGDALARLAADKTRTHEVVERLRARSPFMTLKLQGMRETPVRLLGGTVVQVRAQYLYARPTHPTKPQRGEAGTGVFPLLDSLGIAERSTPALRFRVAHAVVESSSVASAREQLLQNGLAVEHKQALRWTYAVSEAAIRARTQAVAFTVVGNDQGEFAGKRIVACVDGGRVRIRKALRGAPRKGGRRPFDVEWREPKVLTVYELGEDGRRAKKVRSVIDATMGDADAVFDLLLWHLRRLGAHRAEHLSIIGDGAVWIWKRAEELRLALDLPPERFTEITDYYHVVERLFTFARSRPGWTDPEAVKWAQSNKALLKTGAIEAIEQSISQNLTAEELESGTEQEYWSRNRERMRYARFRHDGLPNGSGAVESAVRRVLNLRMKGPGTAWKADNAEGMLHMRAYSKAGRWGEIESTVLGIGGWKPKRRRRPLK